MSSLRNGQPGLALVADTDANQNEVCLLALCEFSKKIY